MVNIQECKKLESDTRDKTDTLARISCIIINCVTHYYQTILG